MSISAQPGRRSESSRTLRAGPESGYAPLSRTWPGRQSRIGRNGKIRTARPDIFLPGLRSRPSRQKRFRDDMSASYLKWQMRNDQACFIEWCLTWWFESYRMSQIVSLRTPPPCWLTRMNYPSLTEFPYPSPLRLPAVSPPSHPSRCRLHFLPVPDNGRKGRRQEPARGDVYFGASNSGIHASTEEGVTKLLDTSK